MPCPQLLDIQNDRASKTESKERIRIKKLLVNGIERTNPFKKDHSSTESKERIPFKKSLLP